MKLLIYFALSAALFDFMADSAQAQSVSGSSTAQLTSAANLTSWHQHRRQKRFLVFPGGGIVKMLASLSMPAFDFNDKHLWRQMFMIINLQWQYNAPPTPIYWWNKFGKRSYSGPASKALPPTDEPQRFVYEFATNYINKQGMNGTACLQRLICENAQVQQHAGLFAELLHRILIPHRSLAAHYRDAYSMGQHGVHCRESFPAAAAQDCILDRYVQLHDLQASQTLAKYS